MGLREDQHIVMALREVGINVSSIYDLVNTKRPYPEAIPVLLGLLPTVSDDVTKEGIVRALTVKEARGVAAHELIEEFKQISPQAPPPKQLLKWAIGNALSVVASEDVFDELVKLLLDKSHGKAREMLAEAIANAEDPRAADVLIRALNDDEIAGHVISALAKLKAQGARVPIERFLNHPKAWIRREAKRALAEINKV